MLRNSFLALLVWVSMGSLVSGAIITGVSIPENSMDSDCYPLNSGIWSVTGTEAEPVHTKGGIGNIVNPDKLTPFVLHDHHYVNNYMPDTSRAIITYEFDEAVYIDKVTVDQHRNGIIRVQVLVGDSLDNMTSIGNIFGNRGYITGSDRFFEHEISTFDFAETDIAGKYFQLKITMTSLHNGWAAYQIVPEYEAVPEPATMTVLLVGTVMLLRRRA